jgi:hypothetical protein
MIYDFGILGTHPERFGYGFYFGFVLLTHAIFRKRRARRPLPYALHVGELEIKTCIPDGSLY